MTLKFELYRITADSMTVTVKYPNGDEEEEIGDEAIDLLWYADWRTYTLTAEVFGTELTNFDVDWRATATPTDWITSESGNTYTVAVKGYTMGMIAVTAASEQDPATTITITIRVVPESPALGMSYQNGGSGSYLYIPNGGSLEWGSDPDAATSFVFRTSAGGSATFGAGLVWSVDSAAADDGVAIARTSNSTATLTVPASYDQAITVRLRHSADYLAAYGMDESFTVNVYQAPQAVAATTETTKTVMEKSGASAVWIQIATYGDYSLIVRKTMLGDPLASNFGDSLNYNDSNLKKAIDEWYGALDKGSLLVTKAVPHDALSKLGTTSVNVNSGFSIPNGGSDTGAFALSSGEAIRFLSKDWKDQTGTTVTALVSAPGYQNSVQMLNPNLTVWLRSPGYGTDTISRLYAQSVGAVGRTLKGYYVRPALWVDSSFFD
jgi:hypothetical protein